MCLISYFKQRKVPFALIDSTLSKFSSSCSARETILPSGFWFMNVLGIPVVNYFVPRLTGAYALAMPDTIFHEETHDPVYADQRNFYKVEKWSRS